MSTINPSGTSVPSRIAAIDETDSSRKDSNKKKNDDDNDNDNDNKKSINDDKTNSGSKNVAERSRNSSSSSSNDQGTKQPRVHQQRRSIATSGSLFVAGFAHQINKTHIEKLFSKFGRPKRISDFMTGQKSDAKFCFVELDSTENAQKAIDSLHMRMLLNKRLVVQPATNKDDSSSSTRSVAVQMSPAKERILIDQKIAALKKKIKESQSDD